MRRSSPRVSRSTASGLDCDGAGGCRAGVGAAWDGGGPQACPGGHRPSACQVPCTHTRAFRCLQGPQTEGARLSSAGRLLRSLRRAHSAVCDLKTPRTGCWFCGLARWQHQVLWGPVLDMGHTSAAVRSRAHGPKPAMTEGHRLVCCLSVCETRGVRTQPAATAVPGATARSGFPDPEAAEMPR